MRFMPSSLSSKSHRLLTALVDLRHKKVYKVKNCIAEIDPERERKKKKKRLLAKLSEPMRFFIGKEKRLTASMHNLSIDEDNSLQGSWKMHLMEEDKSKVKTGECFSSGIVVNYH